MNNKELVTKFLQTAALKSPREAYEKYVASNFKHHNQYFRGDRSSLLEAMEEDSKVSPNKSINITQLIEEADRVVAYSHVQKEHMDIAVFHMFRIAEGKIIEMWDVGQVISPESPNENGLF